MLHCVFNTSGAMKPLSMVVGCLRRIRKIFVEHRPNMDTHTMQAREWQRGWNDAYYEQLEEVQFNEARGRS
jgi:hypothetical protein